MEAKKEKLETEFKQYKRKGLSEIIPFNEFVGQDMSNLSVSEQDKLLSNEEFEKGYVARNPKNHADMWYVAKKYFDDNFEPAMEAMKTKEEIKTYPMKLHQILRKYLKGILNTGTESAILSAMEEYASQERAEGKKEGIKQLYDLIEKFECSPVHIASILRVKDELLKKL